MLCIHLRDLETGSVSVSVSVSDGCYRLVGWLLAGIHRMGRRGVEKRAAREAEVVVQ